KTSNEHSKAGGQACLLINGSAATAVIAYLAKDEVSCSMSKDAVGALMGYGPGVVCAALMIISVMQCLDSYSQYWLAKVEKRISEMTQSSLACQESALHGLGHLHPQCPHSVDNTVAPFISA